MLALPIMTKQRGLPLPVLAVGAAAVWWFTSGSKKESVPATTATLAPGPCVIQKGDVAFPSQVGLEAFTKSVASGDDQQAQTQVATANGAFVVETGATCTLMSAIGGIAKVRLGSGAHSGEVAFLPVERVLGK